MAANPERKINQENNERSELVEKRNEDRHSSLVDGNRDATSISEQSKESVRIRDEVRAAMGESSLLKYRRNLTSSPEQSKESVRIRDEVRSAMGESSLEKYRLNHAASSERSNQSLRIHEDGSETLSSEDNAKE